MHTARISRRSCLLGAALAPLLAEAQAAEPRIALVIGNAAYPTAPLVNSTNDAKAMATQLAALGFAVIELRDARAAAMRAAVATMLEKLAGRRGTGLFYYAGHGLQLDWRNYLLPLDANPVSADEVREQCLDMQVVFDALREARTRTNVVVLDACRDNPFSTTASGKGLAPLDAPVGTYIAYATAPGNVAEDGRASGGNGLFTGYLLEQLRQPVARIEDVFKRVRFQVQAASAGRQVPWDSSSLVEDFYFGRSPQASAASASPTGAAALPAVDRDREEWDRLMRSDSIEEVTAFLLRHPNGRFTEQALHRLDQLQGGRIVAQPGPREAAPLAPGRRRYEAGDRLEYRCLVGRQNAAVKQMKLACTFANDHIVTWSNLAPGADPVATDALGTVQRYEADAFGGLRPPESIGGPAEISLGKRWRSVSLLSKGYGLPFSVSGWKLATAELEHRAVARERIEVPAGTFEAFRVEAQGWRVADRQESRLSRVLWLDPATMTVLRIDATDRPAVAHNPNPERPFDPRSLEHFQRFELVHMHRMAR
ncbi:MAG: caspase family protein [Rubrivivax sp.]|nr:caspase family protein [Rubrivivax sp.]